MIAGGRSCSFTNSENEAQMMTWWSWIIGGAILLGAELTFVSAQFYLVFIGTAAIVVGLTTGATVLPGWAQWGLFAVLAVVSMLAFRSRVYQKFHGRLPTVSAGPAGGVLTLGTALAAGESCQTEYRGTFWTVRNESDVSIPSGAPARITSVRDLTLLVRPDR
jgi:membrane protein implicated in regulation of membrane protease activity